LVGAEESTLSEQVVYKGRFSVVNVRYDGDVTDILI
jgi:hypothetical protein